MNPENSDLNTKARPNPMIDRLPRQTTAAGSDPVPASVYEAQQAHWAANYATRLAERARSERAELLATSANAPMPGDH